MAAACPTGYVALGDSYAAGVGAPAYLDATCLRSTGGYPSLLAAADSLSPFTFNACSGATTADLLANQLTGLDKTTKVVTVTIGGNDLGFSSGLGTCMQGTDADCATVVAAAETFARQTLPGRLDTVYAAVKKAAPRAAVVVTGYAHFFETSATDCAAVPPASLTKRVALNEAVDVLDATIKQRATRAGARFADVRGAFASHGLCGDDPWLHGLDATAFHPNADGYREGYLPAVEKAVTARH